MERLPGVMRAEVRLEKSEARVEFEDARISPDTLVAAIDRLGFRAKLASVTPGRQ